MANPEKIGTEHIQKVALVDTTGTTIDPATGTTGTQDVNVTNDPLNAEIITNGEAVSVQNPIPADGDSIYVKDIDFDSIHGHTDNGDFSGTVDDYFNSLETVNTNTTSDAIKSITVWFERTQYSDAVGLGCDDQTKGFSQTVTLKLLGSGAVIRKTIVSNTGSLNSRLIQFEPSAFNGFTLEFSDVNEVSLSNITIRKAITTESTIRGQKIDGTTAFIGASDSGNLKTTDAENGLAIASGQVVGTGYVHKFGNAPNFDSVDGEVTIFDGAESGAAFELMQYVYSLTADIDSISSDNAADNQIIELQGLDASYNLVVQTATLNGQNKVTLTTPLIRIFRAKNIDTTDLLGHVIVYVDSAITNGIPDNTANVRAVVHPENNQSEMAVYTVPAGKTAYMRSFYAATSGANKDTSYIVRLKARKQGSVFQLKHKSALADTGTSYVQHKYIEPQQFSEKTDIEMTAIISETGKTDASISAGFDIVLKDN